ncbi:MAG: hypothetical protein M1816_007673 [Peltula sp. TS41687]|nr:MAG: hypothetical protein M1816_007673 [Peltula sp. TS41687]
MASEDALRPAQPMKFSRYRSVRKAAATRPHRASSPPPPMPQQSPSEIAVLQDSVRAREKSSIAHAPPQSVEAQQRGQRVSPPVVDDRFKDTTTPRSRTVSSPQTRTRVTSDQRDRGSGHRRGLSTSAKQIKGDGVQPEPRRVDPIPNGALQENAIQKKQNRTEDEATGEREIREDFLKRQKRRELERLEKELSQATPITSFSPLSHSKNALSAAFASRKKHPVTPPTTSESNNKTSSSQRETKEVSGIKPGGGGVVPGIDAPKSAVNSGERRVKIRYGETNINLPVLPSTAAVDLIHAANQYIDPPIDPKTSILLESFTQLGLERRIRKYEHIRDILNSWGRDSQNSLIVAPAGLKGQDPDLEVTCAPRKQPGETTVYLYHSQQPGKWKKRWITLRADGQMTLSKKQIPRPKDITNICHLSDFDIYNITPRQMSKVIKPPKKQCFAVKSQQKSSIFLSTENFVHFFSTDDKDLAAQWYRAIQEWRSWYLVNRLGEGLRVNGDEERTSSLASGSRHVRSSGGSAESPEKAVLSSGPSPAQPGKFAPLLAEDFQYTTNIVSQDSPLHPTGVKDSRALHSRNMSMREHRAPPVSFPSRLNGSPPNLSDRQPEHGSGQDVSPPPGDAPFAPNGLLGRTYSLRQKAQHEQELPSKQGITSPPRRQGSNEEPPIRSSMEAGNLPKRTNSIRSVKNPANRTTRNACGQGQKAKPQPQPLLDFSNPEFREAPQFIKKGRGYLPQQPLAGGLIDAATSPDVAIAIPPSSAWRRPHHSMNMEPPPRPGTSGHAQATPPPVPRTAADGEALTGLVRSGTRRAAGAAGGGRGVKTGDRNAKEPLLDLNQRSKFVPGSLLARAESKRVKGGPVIDRA